MQKNEKEPINGGSIKMLFRIFGFVKPYWGLLFLSMLLNVIFSTFETISIALIKPIFQIIFDQTIETGDPSGSISFFEGIKNSFYNTVQEIVYVPNDLIQTLVYLSIMIICIFICKNFFKYLGAITTVKVQEGVVKNIRDRIFSKMTSLSLDFFARRKEGFLISVITNDVTVVNSSTINSFTIMLRELTQILLFFFLLITISPYLTFIAFSTSVVSLLVVRFAIKFLRRYAKRMQIAMADYTSCLQESIFGIRVIKAYNAENNANASFFSQTAKYVHSAVKHKKIVSLIPSINEVFAILALCVVLFVGGTQVLEGSMQADDLMLFLFALFAIMSPVSIVVNQISMFQSGFVAAERVFSIIDAESTVKSGTKSISDFKTKIEIQDLSFKYDSNEVIKNANLEINKCDKIAFVGSSGSGKSTMLDLIIRFYDPQKGQIRIDGTNIKELDIKQYRSLFGIVSQETLLFNDSVANNIRYGYEKATMDDIIEASKVANAYNFIMNLPEGFETNIGDRGVLLSGGERQRIAIARALIRNPLILVFDEATSALDAESEKVVQNAINQSLQSRTAIIVAHRLATIIDCDLIIVFDKGEIVEAGRHEKLIELDGIYRKLYDIQFAKKGLE